MRFFRDPPRLDPDSSSVVTIGNFDGVHVGHQALISRCRELARPGESVAVVTFEPLPRAWFDPASAPARITGPAQKLAALDKSGVDLAWMMRFNGRLAAMSAREFVEAVLVRGLRARHVLLGPDFRFGRGREGDVAQMSALGDALGFGVETLDPVQVGGKRVSSTGIREAMAAGKIRRAASWLGRPVTLCGRVVRGRRLGRELGYPTANVQLPRGGSPLNGIFAVRARVGAGTESDFWYDGVANVGHRPAAGGGDALLEVHLFDFDGGLYGRWLETRFVERLREEQDFPGLDALVAQMKQDETRARAVLAGSPAPMDR